VKIYLVAYAGAVAAFVIIDGIWLGLVAKKFYANQLGDLLRKNFLIVPGALFYLFYTAGLVFLAVRPSQPDLPLANVALYGAVVGCLAYGTYDMTNLSTLRNWPRLMSVVDMIWGTVLSASVATASAVCVRFFLQSPV
jgi:uncharacterized membrane protein